jgi:hypothetical protein
MAIVEVFSRVCEGEESDDANQLRHADENGSHVFHVVGFDV